MRTVIVLQQYVDVSKALKYAYSTSDSKNILANTWATYVCFIWLNVPISSAQVTYTMSDATFTSCTTPALLQCFLSCIYFPFVSPLSLSFSLSDCCRGPDAWLFGSVSVCFQERIPTWCWFIYIIITPFDPHLIACWMSAMKPSNLIWYYHCWFTRFNKEGVSAEDKSEASQTAQFFFVPEPVQTPVTLSICEKCHMLVSVTEYGISRSLTINNIFKLSYL